MNWNIKIKEPSGYPKLIPINGSMTMGRNRDCEIVLRDPTLPEVVGKIWEKPNPSDDDSVFWFRINETVQRSCLGDLEVKEGRLPPGIPLKFGESQITLEKDEEENPLPEFPSGHRAWLTKSVHGAEALWLTKKASTTPLSVYLAGETGTGKEVLAHLIHAWSDRVSGPFITLHCGALPLSLAESELFGHVKGAYTGAISHRVGALTQAHGGTLFLDEVGDLPLDIQVKLLRFLENGEIRSVGADHTSRADVRIICATHHPLLKLVEEGKFRRDLYYRLASIIVKIPTLRDRPEDIEYLATHFASELKRTISPKAVLRLKAYNWPGNVRELRHAIERASGIAGPFNLSLGDDDFSFLTNPQYIAPSGNTDTGTTALTLKEMERHMVLKALRLSNGNRAKAAKVLGIARSTLFEKLKKHGINGQKFQMQIVA